MSEFVPLLIKLKQNKINEFRHSFELDVMVCIFAQNMKVRNLLRRVSGTLIFM